MDMADEETFGKSPWDLNRFTSAHESESVHWSDGRVVSH